MLYTLGGSSAIIYTSQGKLYNELAVFLIQAVIYNFRINHLIVDLLRQAEGGCTNNVCHLMNCNRVVFDMILIDDMILWSDWFVVLTAGWTRSDYKRRRWCHERRV